MRPLGATLTEMGFPLSRVTRNGSLLLRMAACWVAATAFLVAIQGAAANPTVVQGTRASWRQAGPDGLKRQSTFSGYRRGFLSTLRRMTLASGCSGIKCFSPSTCVAAQGVPSCVCPPGASRITVSASGQYQCSAKSQANAYWLEPQNSARAAVGVPPLKWSSNLAGKAQQWLNSLTTGQCKAYIQPQRDGYGQNTAGTFQSPITGVRHWVLTGGNYSLAPFNSPADSGCATGNWQDCSTYLQVVWQYTSLVGCARRRCTGGAAKSRVEVSVCNYYPPGLVNNYYPYSPCYRTTCAKGQVCDPYTGTVPATCGASPCGSVSCPQGATCGVGTGSIPYCACSLYNVLTGTTCTPVTSPSQLAPQTSIALYPSTNYDGQPFVARIVPSPPSNLGQNCINLPSGLLQSGGAKSIQVIWNVRDSALSGGIPISCSSNIAFWKGPNCGGGGTQYKDPPGGFTTFVQSSAASFVQAAKSISCS